jgi:hypothetical protein
MSNELYSLNDINFTKYLDFNRLNISKELYLFLGYSFLDNYLNPNIGANDKEIFDIFMTYINNIDVENENIDIDVINIIFSIRIFLREKYIQVKDFIIGDYTPRIININKESHSMKLIYLNHNSINDEFILVNSGKDKEDNTCFTRYLIPVSKLNDFITIIKTSPTIVMMYGDICIWRDDSLIHSSNFRNFELELCPEQQSGSCTYFSTLYSIIFLIYYLSGNISIEKKIELGKKIKESLKAVCLESLKKLYLNNNVLIKNKLLYYDNYLFLRISELICKKNNLNDNNFHQNYINIIKNKLFDKIIKKEKLTYTHIAPEYRSFNYTNVNYDSIRTRGLYHIFKNGSRAFNNEDCALYNDYLVKNYNTIAEEGLNLFFFLAFTNKMIELNKCIEMYAIFVKVLEDNKLNLKIGIYNITNFHLTLIFIINKSIRNMGKIGKIFYGLFFMLIFMVFDNVILKEKNIKMGLYNDRVGLIYENYDEIKTRVNLNYNDMDRLYFCNITMYKKAANYLYKYRSCITVTNDTESDIDELVIQDVNNNNNIIFMTHYRLLLDFLFNKKVSYLSLLILPGIHYKKYMEQKNKLGISSEYKYYNSLTTNINTTSYKIRYGYIYCVHNSNSNIHHPTKLKVIDNIQMTHHDKMYFDDDGTMHEVWWEYDMHKINNKLHNSRINDNIEYLYVNPFDILLSDIDSLSNLLYTNHRLLPSKYVEETDKTNKLYCYLYNNSNNDIINYYDDSLNIFIGMLISMNKKKYGQKKLTLTLIYIYSLFYELNNDQSYNDILNYLRNKYEDDNDNDIFKKNQYLGTLKHKITFENIQNFALKLNNKDKLSFIDLVTINYFKNEIFAITNNKQNNIHITNIQQEQNIINGIKFTYVYKYKKEEYVTNNSFLTFISENTRIKRHLDNYYNTFFNINADDILCNFSSIYPALKTIANNIVLFENEEYILQYDNIELLLNEINIIYNHALIFGKNINDQKIYYDYVKYNTNSTLYITKINNTKYIYDKNKNNDSDNLIITNASNLIKNVSNLFNFDIILTKNKMIITSHELIFNLEKIILKNNLFGVDIDINLDYYFTELKIENKHNNVYFEYDIITKEYDNKTIIHDIIMTDKISSYILLVILARTYDYELLMKLYNKFLSILDPYIVYIYTNHPYSYTMHKKINEYFGGLRMDTIPVNFFKYNQLIKDNNEIMKYFNADILIDKQDEFGGRLLQNNSKLVSYFMDNDNFEDIITINNPYLNTMKKINSNFEYRIINTGENTINQEHCVFSILNNIIKERSVTYEMMMGFGKSKVIIPNVCIELIFNNNKKQILIVLPEHLTNAMYESFNEISQYFSLHIVKYMKNIDDQNLLDDIVNGIIITSDITLKTILINTNPSNKVLLFNDINKNSRIMIVDEIDSCINPKTSALNLRLDENFVYKDIQHYDKIIMFIVEYCLELQKYKNKTFCKNYKEIINSKKVFDSLDKLLISICGYSDDELDKIELENQENYNIYKNKVLIYILKKIYDVTDLFEKDVFIYNKDYGLGNDPKKSSYYYTVPYSGIDIPMNDSEFNDIYLTLFSTIYVYLNDTFKLRENDYNEIKKKIINDDINSTIIKYNDIPVLSDDEIKNIKNKSVEYIKSIKDDIRIKIFYISEIISQKIIYIKSYKNTSFLEVFNRYTSHVRIAMTGTPEYIGRLPGPYDNSKLIFPVIGDREIFNSEINVDYSTKKYSLNLSSQFFKNITFVDELNKITVFNYIKLTNEKLTRRVRAFIDAGAVFRFKSQKEYAIDFINELDYSDVFYFEKDDNLYHLYKDKLDPSQFISDLIGINKEKQIEKIRNDINFIIFYDNVHTRGTDIKLPSKTHGLITISKFNDSVNIEQSMYRLRELGQLDSQNNVIQTCEFIADNNIKNENIKGDLYKYLKHRTEIYNSEQIVELFVQTIYANSKFLDDYYTKYENIPIKNILYPTKNDIKNEGDDNLKTLLNYRYSLKTKLKGFCDYSKIASNAYCQNIKKYMKKAMIDTSNSITTSTSTSININSTYVTNIINLYEKREPYGLMKNSPYAVYDYNNKKMGYLAYITYLYLDNKQNHNNSYVLKLLEYFIENNNNIHLKNSINIITEIGEYEKYIEKNIKLICDKLVHLQNFYNYFIKKYPNYKKLEYIKICIDDMKKYMNDDCLIMVIIENKYNETNMNPAINNEYLEYLKVGYKKLKSYLENNFNFIIMYPDFISYIYKINASYEYEKYIKSNPSSSIEEIIKNELIRNELENSIILFTIVEKIFDNDFNIPNQNYDEFVNLINLMKKISNQDNNNDFDKNVPNQNIIIDHIKIIKNLEEILKNFRIISDSELYINYNNFPNLKNAINNLKFDKNIFDNVNFINKIINIKKSTKGDFSFYNYDSLYDTISQMIPHITIEYSSKINRINEILDNYIEVQNPIISLYNFIYMIILIIDEFKSIMINDNKNYYKYDENNGYKYVNNLNSILGDYYKKTKEKIDKYHLPDISLFKEYKIINKIYEYIGINTKKFPIINNYDKYMELIIYFINQKIFDDDNSIKLLISKKTIIFEPLTLENHYYYINNMLYIGEYTDTNIIKKYHDYLNYKKTINLTGGFDINKFIQKKLDMIENKRINYYYLDDSYIIQFNIINKMINAIKNLEDTQKNKINIDDDLKIILEKMDNTNISIDDDFETILKKIS